MSRASRRPPAGAAPTPADDADELAGRWRDVGRLLARLAPEVFEAMVRAAEVTAVVLSEAREGAQ